MIMEQNQSAPALELGQSSKTPKFVLGRGFLLSSFIASVSFAASVLVPSVSYANEPQIIFQENGWIAFPKQKDPEKGCVMGRHIKNNVHAIIYVNNNETFQIGLTSADWRLEQGTEWNGAIAFDSDRSIATMVRASFKNTVVVPSGAGEDSLENRIRTAARVRISFNNETYDVSLKGSSNALDMLWSCAEGGMGASSFSLPIQSGFYAIADGNCSDGLGPNVIYTDSKSLNWPSSACRFENVEKINQSQYRVKQTCGRNLDDVETTEDIYTIQSATRFSIKYGDQLTALNRCNPKTLPQAAGVTSPFYALPTTEEIADHRRSKFDALPNAGSEGIATEDDDSTWQKRQENRRRKQAEEEARNKAEYEAERKRSSEEMRRLSAQSQNPADQVPRGESITLSYADENAVKELIGLRLHDETSARFRNFAAAELPDGTYVVCGFVNGKNQFGAYTGYTLFYSNYRPDTKNFTYFIMANNENIATLCRLNGVVFQ
ncbi:hypothetical protein ACFW0F_05295 [Brucella anthropi]|uniref:hypothetical protein n=1 Tax=Brucella anthropi TaxID=529 RepID=UPI00366CEB4C